MTFNRQPARRSAFQVVCRAAVGLCLLVSLLPACSVVQQLGPDEQESVRQNKKAIVFFRLTGSLDSKEVHLLREISLGNYSLILGNYPHQIVLSFGLANMEAREPISEFPVGTGAGPWVRSYGYFSPSSEIAENGWGAFLLEPGTYYLHITSLPKGAIAPIPEFRFIVPPNVPLVYIGSLHVACTTIADTGWVGGRGFAFGSCSSDATAANEEGAAKLVAQASFRDIGSPSTMIMQRYDPNPLPSGTISTVAPVGLLVPQGKIDLGSPEWMGRAIATGLLPSAGLVALGGTGGGGLGAVGLFMGAIAWAPVGVALGYVGGKVSESSWEPCRQVLQESLSKFEPMAVFGTKLKAALDHVEVPALEIDTKGEAGDGALASDMKSIFNVQIQRIVLHLCLSSFLSKAALCLEVATHARLFETATQIYLYDRMFVYSAGEGPKKLQPYELSVLGSTTLTSGRDLEAYCGEGGSEILAGDLSDALDATVYRVVQDLGLKVE